VKAAKRFGILGKRTILIRQDVATMRLHIVVYKVLITISRAANIYIGKITQLLVAKASQEDGSVLSSFTV